MEWLWIGIVMFLIASSAATVGTFYVNRGIGMMGDAIAHAVLPGIIVAFILFHSLDSWRAYGFAILTAIGLAVLMEWIYQHLRHYPEAILGFVYTTFFAIGLVLLNWFAYQVDLDPQCVLFGEAIYIPFVQRSIAGLQAPWAFWQTVWIWLVATALFWFGRRALWMTAFDPTGAQVYRFYPHWWRYIVAVLTAILTVTALEIVGVVMVVGLMVLPPASALQYTIRPFRYWMMSQVFALVMVVAGITLAVSLNWPLSVGVVLIGGLLLGPALIQRRRIQTT